MARPLKKIKKKKKKKAFHIFFLRYGSLALHDSQHSTYGQGISGQGTART